MIVKYFELRPETDLKIIGKSPQIQTVEDFTKEKNELFSSLSSEYFPEAIPDFNSFSFENAAKITDLVSNRFIHFGIGILVNERLKSIIEQFRCENTRFYEANLKKGRKSYLYNFMYLLDSTEFIDFSKSSFGIGDPLGRPKGPLLEAANIVELKSKVKEMINNKLGSSIVPLSIALKEEIDMVRIPLKAPIYISEKLKSRLIEENITGCSMEESKVQFIREAR